MLSLPRRKVRYHLYRLRTKAERIRDAEDESGPFGVFFAGQEGFDGWENFARTWDVGPEGKHDRVVRRLHTEEQLWNMKLAKLAMPLRRK